MSVTTNSRIFSSRTSNSRILSPTGHAFGQPQVFYQADDGKSAVGGSNENANQSSNPQSFPPQQQQQQQQQSNSSSIAAQVRSAIDEILGAKSGDVNAALETLVRRNHALEQRAEAAEQQRLSQDDSALLAAVKQLELTPEKLSNIISQHSEWGAERARNAKAESLKKAAQVAGLNAELLASLEGALDAEYSVVGEGDNAKALVKVKSGESVVDVPLDEWAGEKWPSLKEVLSASNKPDVVPYGKSAPQSSGRRENVFDRIRAEKREQQKQQEKTSGNWMERAGVAR